MMNQMLTSFFKSKIGLQQGCPISLFLYIIMDEALSGQVEFEKS